MLLGAHMSIGGGLHLAVKRIRSVDGTALQIFTRNQRQWRVPALTKRAIADFRAAMDEWGDYPVAAHDSYLINLSSPDASIRRKSVTSFSGELRRAQALAIPFLVTHPGTHGGDGVRRGIGRYVQNLDRAISRSGTDGVDVLLETTAGQGTGLGRSFEELARIIGESAHSDRLGVCLDTCHVWAAGYDIRSKKGYEGTLGLFDELVGLDRIRFFHINDSKHARSSLKDRHEHAGKGAIGLTALRRFVRDPRFRDVGKVIETPKEKDLEADRINLSLLRK
jgi:deoxyribonuclease-4